MSEKVKQSDSYAKPCLQGTNPHRGCMNGSEGSGMRRQVLHSLKVEAVSGGTSFRGDSVMLR